MERKSDKEFATRKKILKSALIVLAKKKVSGTRVRQIAREAGMSQGTLHYYYPSKMELILDVLDEMQRFFEEREISLKSEDLETAEKLRLFFLQQQNLLKNQSHIEEVFLDFWGQSMNDPVIRSKISSMFGAWKRDINKVISKGVQEGKYSEENSHMASYLLISLLEGASLQYLLNPSSFSLEEYFDASHKMVSLWLKKGKD